MSDFWVDLTTRGLVLRRPDFGGRQIKHKDGLEVGCYYFIHTTDHPHAEVILLKGPYKMSGRKGYWGVKLDLVDKEGQAYGWPEEYYLTDLGVMKYSTGFWHARHHMSRSKRKSRKLNKRK